MGGGWGGGGRRIIQFSRFQRGGGVLAGTEIPGGEVDVGGGGGRVRARSQEVGWRGG